MVDIIKAEDLEVLQATKKAAQEKLNVAKLYVAESNAADLEYRNQVLQVFIKYKLNMEDGFDDLTGVIKRASVVETIPAETTVGNMSSVIAGASTT